jgi:hypothetical protein
MTVEMVAPAWMHQQVTAEQYAAWTEEQCAGIEIVDGMVLVSPTRPEHVLLRRGRSRPDLIPQLPGNRRFLGGEASLSLPHRAGGHARRYRRSFR